MLRSLDRAASSLRGKLGESIGSVQKFATPLDAATTSSLEALQAFSLGQAEHQKFDDLAAIPHLKRALELDPNFAMALATLGVACNNEGDTRCTGPSTFAAKPFLKREMARRQLPSIRKFLITGALLPSAHSISWLIWGSVAPMRFRGIQQRQNWRTRISSRCGRKPIRMFPF